MSNDEKTPLQAEVVEMEAPDTQDYGKVGLLLNYASKNDCSRIVALIRGGLDPSAADYDKRAALHLAVAEGHMDAAKLLVQEGANVNCTDRFGLTPLDEAVRNNEPELVEFLKANGAEMGDVGQHQGELIQAASQNNVADAERLIAAGIDPNCGDYDNRTPLHLSVAEGHIPLTKVLLEAKADPTKEDRWGVTPLKEIERHHVRTGVNKMAELFAEYHIQPEHEEGYFSWFNVCFTVMQVLIIVLFFFCTEYDTALAGGDGSGDPVDESTAMARYPLFQDVNVMIFIGFGYLMTFLRKNAYNSLGLTFLVSAFAVQWHMLVGGFMHQAFCRYGAHPEDCEWHPIKLSLDSMIVADFAAGAVLITYGALLGKVTPFQLMLISLFEVVFFTINENIGLTLGIVDMGGSMVVHMFGAYFGLAASFVLKDKAHSNNDNNAAVYHSDMFAMIGTIFLWLFWPSFNGAMASGYQQQRVAVNTFLALSASCVMGFLASHILRKEKRFNMVDVQNATLAGGVAMGTCADLIIGPGAAILIGSIAGTVSVYGYVFIQPVLEEKVGIHDTCGVNNLHGMPSIIGAVAGMVAASMVTAEKYGNQLDVIFGSIADGSRTAKDQALAQLYFCLITLAMALVTGAITGAIVKQIGKMEKKDLFIDENFWEVPNLETPYFFDDRGEVKRVIRKPSAVVKVSVDSRVARLEQQLAAMSAKQQIARIQDEKQQTAGPSKMEQVLEKILKKLD